MTATEVNAIRDQQMSLMGPVLGRQHFEFLRPLIERLFGIMARRGLISPAPKQIQGKKFDVRYSSLVARAQRMSEGQNLSRAIGVAAPIIQAQPQTLDNLNGDEALKYIFGVYGVPHRLMNSKKVVDDTRNARAQAQQEAAQQQQEAHQAEIAGKTLPGMAMMKTANDKGQ